VELEAQTEEAQALTEELEETAEQLRHAVEEAEQANRAKTEFLAVMSHELRAPLNAIGGYAELLAYGVRGPVTAAQREDLERIRASQQRLLGMINDILNFTRLEGGRITYELSPIAMRDVFETVTPLIDVQARTKGLRCTIESCDAVAIADRAKVEQILLNLISNAVKFTEPGGSVTSSCTTLDNHVVVTVTDTGIGIPPEQLAAIFEPFVQIGRGLTRPVEGTGLGLAISRDLAAGMNGTLDVSSTPGAGSTFTLTLPRAS